MLLFLSRPAIADQYSLGADGQTLTPVGPHIPTGLGKTCKERQDDANDIRNTYNHGTSGNPRPIDEAEQAPGECYKKIIQNYNKCATVEQGVGMSDDGGGSVKGVAKQMTINTAKGVEQNTEKAHDCKVQKEDASKRCHELADQIKQAIHDNADQERQYMAEDHPAAEKAEMKQRFHETSLKLQAKYRNTGELVRVHEKALDNFSQCFSDEAQRAQIIHDYSVSQQNSAASDLATDTAKDAPKSTAQQLADEAKNQAQSQIKDGIKDRVKDKAKEIFLGTGEAVEGEVAQKGLEAAGATTPVAEKSGATFGSKLLGAGRYVAGTPGIWMGAATTYFGSTVPAGNCSAMYTNAFSANLEGCSLSTQSVVNSLNGH